MKVRSLLLLPVLFCLALSVSANGPVTPAVPEATNLTFDQYLQMIKKDGKLVLVDFTAVWCGPCRMLKPKVEKVVKARSGKVDLIPVDVDKNPDVSRALNIQSIPLLILYKDGKEVWRFLGLTEESVIADAIDKHSGK